jgi:hypothetical protein
MKDQSSTDASQSQVNNFTQQVLMQRSRSGIWTTGVSYAKQKLLLVDGECAYQQTKIKYCQLAGIRVSL